MDGISGRGRLLGYLPHAFVATLAVAVLPLLISLSLEAAGILRSTLASVALSVGMSAGASILGSMIWSRRPGARDIVFGDLLLWGWMRRWRTEKSIAEMIEVLGADRPGSPEPSLAPERRIELLKKLAAALEARDPYTHGHTERVARHSYMIAKAMGLSAAETLRIRTAAAVHDVGKLHVPDEVLNKPGKLTDEEFDLMKRHAAAGASMVSAVGDDELTALVRYHHERFDGRGYPDGISGTEIPLGARIIAVADTFDAITSTRSYRAACPHKKAIDIIKKEAGTQLDPDAVNAFLTYYSGRNSRVWWWSLSTAPQRLLARLIAWLQEVGVARAASTAIAMGGAAAVVGAPVPAAIAQQERPPARVAVASSAPQTPDPSGVVALIDRESGTGDHKPGRKARSHKGRVRGDHHKKNRRDNENNGPGEEQPGDDGNTGDGTEPGNGTDPGGDDSSGGVGDVVDGAGDAVGDIVDGAGDAVGDVVDGAGDAVGDVVEGAGDGVGDLLDGVGDLLP